MPVLIRFGDLLKKTLAELYQAFAQAITTYEYQNTYQGVYPVKTNQQEQVLAAIKHYGKPYHHGFEVGSKAELVAALAYTNINVPQTIIINGYKDAEFINLGLYARQRGIACVRSFRFGNRNSSASRKLQQAKQNLRHKRRF